MFDEAWVYLCGKDHSAHVIGSVQLAGFLHANGTMTCPCGEEMQRYRDYERETPGAPHVPMAAADGEWCSSCARKVSDPIHWSSAAMWIKP